MRLHACYSTVTLLDGRWRMEVRNMSSTYATHSNGDMSEDNLIRLWGEEGECD